jgi:hypothetical protein
MRADPAILRTSLGAARARFSRFIKWVHLLA